MAQPNSFRVFLSAVTNELASCRREVARVLHRKGIEVREEAYFRQGGATLIEALRDYIHDCDAVILLVGEHPHMQRALRNYRNLLAAMNLSEAEITGRIRKIADD